MTWYVRINPINGRHNLMNFSVKLSDHELNKHVEYNNGGWHDDNMNLVAPHLKFDNESDALIYVLSFGGVVEKELPIFKNIKSPNRELGI